MMINLVKPKNFMPIHGEYRHLVLHGRLAEDLDVSEVFVIENGQVIEFENGKARRAERVPGGYVFVDGLTIGAMDHTVLRDRHHLAKDGFVVVVLTVDELTGELIQEPDIITRGFVYSKNADELIEEAKQRVKKVLHAGMHADSAQQRIKETISQFFYERTKGRPMVLPLVIEV